MPNQSPIIQIAEDASGVARLGAGLFAATIRSEVDKKGSAFVALSGGSTPRAMHRLLGQPPHRRDIPWHRLYLFWVDERCVPHTDGASNFGAARRDFLESVDIPRDHIHPMPTEPGSTEAAQAYAGEIERTVPKNHRGMPCFDIVFLGIGEDGHTASLFPNHDAPAEEVRWIIPVRGGQPFVDRYTMTLPVLNAAKQVIFLVSGTPKATMVKEILDSGTKRSLPARQVRPTSGSVTWMLDKHAASRL